MRQRDLRWINILCEAQRVGWRALKINRILILFDTIVWILNFGFLVRKFWILDSCNRLHLKAVTIAKNRQVMPHVAGHDVSNRAC